MFYVFRHSIALCHVFAPCSLDIHTKEYAETGVNTEAQIVDIAEILHSPDSPVLTPYKKPEVEMTNNYTPIPSPPESVTRANAAAGTVDTTPRKLSYVKQLCCIRFVHAYDCAML